MSNATRNQCEIQKLRHEKTSGFIDGAKTDAGTSLPIKDSDTALSMIVLLLACLALAALAHVIV